MKHRLSSRPRRWRQQVRSKSLLYPSTTLYDVTSEETESFIVNAETALSRNWDSLISQIETALSHKLRQPYLATGIQLFTLGILVMCARRVPGIWKFRTAESRLPTRKCCNHNNGHVHLFLFRNFSVTLGFLTFWHRNYFFNFSTTCI